MSTNESLSGNGGEEFINSQAAAIRFAEMQEDTMRLSNLGFTKTITTAFQKTSPGLIGPDSPLYFRISRAYKGSNTEDTKTLISMTVQLYNIPIFSSWPLEINDGKLLVANEEIVLTSQQKDEIERIAVRRPPQSLMDFDHVVAHPFLPDVSH